MGKADFTLEKAMRDPALFYAAPDDVVADSRLDREAKRAILKSWELDARELAVAESENMGGGEPNMLTRVLAALARIDGSRTDAEARQSKIPTMHGNAPRNGAAAADGRSSGNRGGDDMADDATRRNEGEGSRTAAREFNRDETEFARSGEVDKAAEDAKKAVEGKEGDKLREAEKEGRAHAKEIDPAVKRDYEKGKK